MSTTPIRDGHSLNLHLEHMAVALSANCPHAGTDWDQIPEDQRPPCRIGADETPDTSCVIVAMADELGSAAEFLAVAEGASFTATQLPVDVEWNLDGDGYPYVTPIVQPPGEDEYRQLVAAVAERHRAVTSGSAA